MIVPLLAKEPARGGWLTTRPQLPETRSDARGSSIPAPVVCKGNTCQWQESHLVKRDTLGMGCWYAENRLWVGWPALRS